MNGHAATALGPGHSDSEVLQARMPLFGVLPGEQPPQVPEPVTSTLCLMGLGALALRRRKRS